ncbi:MAG: hypothetical protein JXL81_06975 [Deltaproteobacteria bacterium]|nr:hypothetical protein [Deltaproteobacteria bacterium]
MMKIKGIIFAFLVIFLCCPATTLSSSTQKRIDNDISAGKPVVIHVSVALADNDNQGIVPVPASIGNGQDARTNLYWGARYGVKTYLIKDGGWEKVIILKPDDKRILERLILKKYFARDGQDIPVYLVADAWDGRYIRDTIIQFLNYNAGKDVIDIRLKDREIQAGGNAHLIAYVGHNGLMDYSNVSNPEMEAGKPENDAIVLACMSEQYFLSRLKKLGAHPLVLTTGLMAPEAYSLDAAVRVWITGGDDKQVRKAAAESYNRYQKTGLKAAERLFGVK